MIDLSHLGSKQIHVVFIITCYPDAQITVKVCHMKTMPDFPLYFDHHLPLYLNHRDDQERFIASSIFIYDDECFNLVSLVIEADRASLKSEEYQKFIIKTRAMELANLCCKYR